MKPSQHSTSWSGSRLVDVGDRSLALSVAGRGQPAVVLEMGLGAAGDFYDGIARGVAALTRVAWYDRAGLGRSDPAPTPRTIAGLAADLHTLLRAAAIPPPYVLVGHSLGGLTVRFYQHHYPAEVAALVLIESAHEAQRERLLAALPPEASDEVPALARYRHALRVSWADPATNAERIDNLANSALMLDCSGFGGLPLVVVSRGRAEAPAGLPPELVAERERTWRQMQDELAALSSHSVHLIAERSGHLINKDQPELVVEAIYQAVTLVRAQE